MMELKPCPFCGENTCAEIVNDYPWIVGCMACGAQGPSTVSADAAIAAWNRRALDPRVADVQSSSALCMAGKPFVAIVEDGGEYVVVQHLASGGVCPPSRHATARKAVARVMQLMKVGPVSAQTWPETAQIGTVEVQK